MVRLKAGDVFVVPVENNRVGMGQVVGFYGRDAYYFAVYDFVVAMDEAVERINEGLAAPVKFLALSMDAKLHAGHWVLVGNAPIGSRIVLPAYKEAIGDGSQFEVVDYSGLRRRAATRAESGTLPNRKIVAPVRLERALRASLGLEPWLAAFEELKPEYIIPSNQMFDA